MELDDLERRTTPQAQPGVHASRGLWRRWPSALGLAVAVPLLATGVADRDMLAVGVTVAAFCYLAAAALGRPWVAWAGIVGATLVIVGSEMVGLVWWAGLGLTGLGLVAFGLRRGAPRQALTQGAALLGFGALALVALALDPRAGLVLAGLTLASHAVWDAVHHRRNEVVPRSLAEACMLFDVVLGLGCIVLALPS